MSDKPRGELTTRTVAMPADSNPAGDIFGGWVLSQMDIAAGISASTAVTDQLIGATSLSDGGRDWDIRIPWIQQKLV